MFFLVTSYSFVSSCAYSFRSSCIGDFFRVWRAFLKYDFLKNFLFFFQHKSILNIPQNKQKAAEGMSGMTVTHAGGEAEVNTVLRIAAKQHVHLCHEDSF